MKNYYRMNWRGYLNKWRLIFYDSALVVFGGCLKSKDLLNAKYAKFFRKGRKEMKYNV